MNDASAPAAGRLPPADVATLTEAVLTALADTAASAPREDRLAHPFALRRHRIAAHKAAAAALLLDRGEGPRPGPVIEALRRIGRDSPLAEADWANAHRVAAGIEAALAAERVELIDSLAVERVDASGAQRLARFTQLLHLDAADRARPLLAPLLADAPFEGAIAAAAQRLPLPQALQIARTIGMGPTATALALVAVERKRWSAHRWEGAVREALLQTPPADLADRGERAKVAALIGLGARDGAGAGPAILAEARRRGLATHAPETDPAFFNYRSRFDKAESLSRETVMASLSPAAQIFLEEARDAGRGVLLCSVHEACLARGSMLSIAAPAALGFSTAAAYDFGGTEDAARYADQIDRMAA